jgi:plastocyanin
VPEAPVVIDQRGCLYQPHVVGVRAGQPLEIRNSDPATHNVHSRSGAGNDVNVSQAAHSPALTVVMTHPEAMLRLTCDVHAWMNIFVAVMSHPYFAVTDASGQFEIAGVPPGPRRLEVWHERYGPQTVDVDVAAGGVREVDVTYAGTEHAAPMR